MSEALPILEPAYDYAAAAARLAQLGYSISERWLREHIGQVPHTKVGREVRFTDSLLAEFLEQQTKRPGASRPAGRPTGGRRRPGPQSSSPRGEATKKNG